jgi:NAD(P)-dependent dehydrogenase (short-subunit alcohol dehydrogenase family)
MANRTILVTGGNRGIGLEICRQCAALSWSVVLGARDVVAGERARASLGPLAARVRVEALVLDDPASINACAVRLSATGGTLDALINNAGMFDKAGEASATTLPLAVLERTLRTNLYGPLLMSQAVLPLLRRSSQGRIVNLSSGMGQLEGMGGGSAAYRISKTALNALTATMAADLSAEKILVHAVCPGWVKTEMGGPGAQREVAQGADTPVWLATDAAVTTTGRFWRDRQNIPW